MKIVNPYYKVRDEVNNIFTIRKKEYDSLLENIRQILIPAEELGFELVDFRLKDPRFSTKELSRTIKKNLIIRFAKGTTNLDLSMQIPELVDDNFIIINGRRKIPQFQLFDVPIVTRGKNIKIRTNVATMMIVEQKDAPYVYMSILGKQVPLYLLFFGYYGIDEMAVRFNLHEIEEPVITDKTVIYEKLLYDMKVFFDDSRGTTQDDIIKEIGRNYTQFNTKDKGEDIVYAFDLITAVDPASARFFKKDTLAEEIVDILKNPDLDDTDMTNKRIRCFEYMVLSKISKAVFDMCLANRSARQPKFSVNSTQIISECNVSDIIQFDFCINPIDELTKHVRTSLVGPGGFNKQNVPEHLRDVQPSMFGRICPVDTPDRDNCGILQNLVMDVHLDENGRFTDEFSEKVPISAPVSMVPFLEHDDQTRLQMSSSQQRQAIMLKQFDRPLIKSGCEGLYSKHTQFVKVAKNDGEILFVNEKMIIIKYIDGIIDAIDVNYRRIYISNMDYLKIFVEKGEKVKKDQILAESNFCQDGEITIGKNLLTSIGMHYGYNYEDGIVLSKRLQDDDVLTSMHFEDLSFEVTPDKVLLNIKKGIGYKPLPEVGDRIRKGGFLAKIKEFPNNQQEYFDIFKQEREIIATQEFVIIEVNIYANTWNEEIPEYNDWVLHLVDSQKNNELKLRKTLLEYMDKVEAEKFIKTNGFNKFTSKGKFKMKGEEINGIFVEMIGVYFRPIQIGDKIGNRHGNKGVISNIVEHEKMPKLPDGRHVDICINPLGIPSRMNVGQLYEIHMGMAVNDIKIQMRNIIERKIPSVQDLTDDQLQKVCKQFIIDFIEIIDKTEDNWYLNQFTDQLPEVIDNEFIDEFGIIQAPFESMRPDDVDKALEYSGTKQTYKVFDPFSDTYIENELTVGMMYFFKMTHISNTRLAARGIGSYTKKTLQPLAGRKNRGGQRLGEMETSGYIGHDAVVNLKESLTTKSDCIDLKNKYIREELGTDFSRDEEEESIVPESVKLLVANFTALGVDRED